MVYESGWAVLCRPTVDYVLPSVVAGWWTAPVLGIVCPLPEAVAVVLEPVLGLAGRAGPAATVK